MKPRQTRAARCLSISDRLRLVLSDLDELRDETQEHYDNMPAGIQDSVRGERLSDNIDAIDSAARDLEEVISNIDSMEWT